MKLKVLKAHYHNGVVHGVGSTYETDANTGKSRVKLGLCSEIKQPKEKKEGKPRRSKKERK